MSKHTPGPWTFAPKQAREIVIKRKHYEVGSVSEVTPIGGKGVAIAFGDDDANARLIAAAPELLEACKTARAIFRNYGENSIAAKLEAAIAKAEGK